MKTKYMKNRDMNSQTYKLRRIVVGLVREAGKLVDNTLPRIEIRIADAHDSNTLGVGRMGKCIIWISPNALDKGIDFAREVVFHEILHAVCATDHDNTCPLMRTTSDPKAPISKAAANQAFLKHFINWKFA